MLRWNASIYMDEIVKQKPSRYRKILEKRKIVKNCYCITLPMNEENCLDMYSSRELWFQYYRTKTIEVVGLAADRERANELLCRIVQDVAKKYDKVDAESVKVYFSS